MPILACRCSACGKGLDYLKSNAADEPVCPECASKEVKRLFAPFAVAGGRDAAPAEGPSCSGDPGSCGRCGSFADA